MLKITAIWALIVLASVAFSGQALAQATQPSAKIPAESSSQGWLTLSTDFRSQYITSNGVAAYRHPVQQTDLTITFPEIPNIPGRFFYDAWNSESFNGRMDSDSGDEIDHTFGWTGKLPYGIGLQLGATYMDFAHYFNAKGDLLQPWISIDRRFDIGHGMALTPFARAEFRMKAQGYEDGHGVVGYLGVKHDWGLVKNVSLFQKVNFIFDDGVCNLQPGTLLDYRAGVDWKLTKWLNFEPIFYRHVQPLGHFDDGRRPQDVVGFGASVSF